MIFRFFSLIIFFQISLSFAMYSDEELQIEPLRFRNKKSAMLYLMAKTKNLNFSENYQEETIFLSKEEVMNSSSVKKYLITSCEAVLMFLCFGKAKKYDK